MAVNPGLCRFCGCSYCTPCPGSCGWADRAQTLCTECVAISRAWAVLPRQPPQFRYAFFRGFVAGAEDERAIEGRNPFASDSARRRYWDLGFARGARLVKGAA